MRCPILFLVLYLACPGLLWADAAVEQRIDALSAKVEHDPDEQTLLLRRSLAYAENGQQALALADIQAAERMGDPIVAAFVHGLLLFRAGDLTAARPYFDAYLQAWIRSCEALRCGNWKWPSYCCWRAGLSRPGSIWLWPRSSCSWRGRPPLAAPSGKGPGCCRPKRRRRRRRADGAASEFAEIGLKVSDLCCWSWFLPGRGQHD